MRKIYISGPMSGIKDNNFPAFHAAADTLRGMGYDAVNPAEINAGGGLTYHEYLRADIKALCDCDTIMMIDGWESSNGAHLELSVAHRLGIKVVTVSTVLALQAATARSPENDAVVA